MRLWADEAWVKLKAPSADDAAVWGCSRTPPRLRLVRQVAPNGAVRVLATNLDERAAPAHAFADLYHLRWRIEELFQRMTAPQLTQAPLDMAARIDPRTLRKSPRGPKRRASKGDVPVHVARRDQNPAKQTIGGRHGERMDTPAARRESGAD